MELSKYIKKVTKSCTDNNIEKTTFDINVLLINDQIVVTNQPTANKIKFTYIKPEE
jgi:hypothetical protein